MEQVVEKKKFYGWVVFVSMFVLVFVLMGLYNTTSSFTSYITKLYGFTRADYQMTWTYPTFVGMIINIFFYKSIVKKIGQRGFLFVGPICMAISFLILSQAKTLPVFWIGGAFIGVATASFTTATVQTLVANWFVKSRGTLSGFALGGTGFGGTFASLIFVRHIDTMGQKLFLIYAVIAVVMGVMALFIIRNKPEDMGQVPLGFGEAITEKQKARGAKLGTLDDRMDVNIEVKDAFRTSWFWLSVIGVLGIGLVAHPVATVLPARLKDAGFSTVDMGYYVSLFYMIIGGWKLVFGRLYDVIGNRMQLLVTMILGIAGTIALGLTETKTSTTTVWIFLLLYTAYSSAQTVQMPLSISSTVGTKNLVKFIGIYAGLIGLGVVVGSQAIAQVFDVTGSYSTMLLYVYPPLILIAVVALIMSNELSKKYKVNLMAKQQAEKKLY